MDERLLAVLMIRNPWLGKLESQPEILRQGLPDPYLPRNKQLDLRPGSAQLVVGPRQAGKSTWIRHELCRQSDPVVQLHAEEPAIQEFCRSPAEALFALTEILVDESILWLEEIQHLKDAPLFIKGLVDLQPHRRIIATGSSSLQFQAKTRESLAGRARRTRLLPFSIDELAGAFPQDQLPALREQACRTAWERLLVFGGYPKPWFEKEPGRELLHLVEAFVLKDASDFHTIEYPAAFRKLLEFSAADIGNLVNISAWTSRAGISRSAASRYLDIAADAHILHLLPPFAGGKRTEITGRPKVFLIDNGLRNSMFAGFGPSTRRPDQGALWENAVFSELLKRTDLLDQIFYWRTKNGAEIDFVVRRGQRLVALEVKATEFTRPQLSRSARSFISAYQPKCLGIVNATLRTDQELDGIPILFRRPWELDEILSVLDRNPGE
ncbi:MAG: ATP-binding protein [Deltaproteobacteria bacterium]|nr:ATP-binding protein [Deltaproteobacteria bacterium]